MSHIAGLIYQFTGMEAIHANSRWVTPFLIGLLVKIFVGTQMAWVPRSYSDTGPFIRPLKGNFHIALIRLIGKFPGGS